MSESSKAICQGCQHYCELNAENNFLSDICGERKIISWPNTNIYFNLGIKHLIFNKCNIVFTEGVIIVNFTIANALFFVNDNWIKQFEQSGLKAILLTDAKMLALAHYWQQHSELISSVILVTSGQLYISTMLQKALSGRAIPTRKFPVVTDEEIATLHYLTCGYSRDDIAITLKCDIRDVYRFQYSLRKKIGGLTHLKDLRLKCFTPVLRCYEDEFKGDSSLKHPLPKR